MTYAIGDEVYSYPSGNIRGVVSGMREKDGGTFFDVVWSNGVVGGNYREQFLRQAPPKLGWKPMPRIEGIDDFRCPLCQGLHAGRCHDEREVD
jgi:hypothetical protein